MARGSVAAAACALVMITGVGAARAEVDPGRPEVTRSATTAETAPRRDAGAPDAATAPAMHDEAARAAEVHDDAARAAEVHDDAAPAETHDGGDAGDDAVLAIRGSLLTELLDYGLPGHPAAKGQSALGVVARLTLAWALDRHVEVEAGVLGRLPFALELDPEAAALPIVTVSIRPLGDERALLRFGSLDVRHGYHPAVVDEARYAYGRDYAATYVQSLAPGVARDVGKDPFLPAEHGVQAALRLGWLRAEGFLDWQLLETAAHREKFVVGLLAEARHELGSLSLQLHLGHYGGEVYTRGDPVRFAGLDPVRQPLTLAAIGVLKPLSLTALRVEVPLGWIQGKLAQQGGAAPSVHQGVELGLEVVLIDRVRLGWRAWLPLEHEHGWVSEDGDPVYAGRRSHRARLVLSECYGPAKVAGRLDLVFAEGAAQVEYLTVTTVSLTWDHVLAGARDGEGAGEERCARDP